MAETSEGVNEPTLDVDGLRSFARKPPEMVLNVDALRICMRMDEVTMRAVNSPTN